MWALDVHNADHPPLPPLRVNVRVFAILAADARGQKNSITAWADVHAIWILSRSLLERPEPSSIRAGLFGRRIIDDLNPSGAKPAWWSDYASFDVKLPLVRSRAYATWQAIEEMLTK